MRGWNSPRLLLLALAAPNENKKKNKKKRAKSEAEAKQVVAPIASSIYDKSYCPDLKIDTAFVTDRSKKYITVNFKITNYGKGPAPLFGESAETEDNVAIRAYISGTAKLSRGDLILGGAYIEDGMEDQNGILQPLESFAAAFRVSIRKKTRFMPYLILSIDDYQSLWECQEGNNTISVLID